MQSRGNSGGVMSNKKTTADTRPALLALDWGTSSLRAFLMDAQGGVIATRATPHGIQNLPQQGRPGFEQAFAEIAADWLQQWPGLPVVAGGMVGSAQGWKEAPYVSCPTDTQTLAAHSVVVDSGLACSADQVSPRVVIAPGILYTPKYAGPDVLRGEEIQIAGVLAAHPEWTHRSCMVLPGTHSKWVNINGERIDRFYTYMTGELYAVLSKHSILGRLFADVPASGVEADAAFADGIAAASASQRGDLPHQLFSVRTLGLTGKLAPGVLKDYLSGLLIGHELVSGLASMRRGGVADMPLVLIGEPALCFRYSRAFALMNVTPAALLENTAPAGLFHFAVAAGLLNANQTGEVQA